MCEVGCSCAEGVGQGLNVRMPRIASAPYSRMNSRTSIRKTVSFCENRSRFTPSRVLKKGAVQKEVTHGVKTIIVGPGRTSTGVVQGAEEAVHG